MTGTPSKYCHHRDPRARSPNRFDQSTELGCNGPTSLALPSRQVRCEPILKLVQFFELRLSFGKRGFGHGNDAAACLLALTAQAYDSPDFIKTEAERLRLADEAHLAQRGLVIDPISA